VKLIDSSSWIHALRRTGDPVIRQRVNDLLVDGSAAWCPIVQVELWQGVKHKSEADFLRQLEFNITLLKMTDAVWKKACSLGQKTRAAGKPVPTTDLLIAACALTHKIPVEHCDRHLKGLLEDF
jgi:predicted nucleic acid-binding protein